jgi:Tol biopolymer transport system component
MKATVMSNLLPQRTASALFSALLLAGVCFGQTTERVSVNSSGVEGDSWSEVPSISADGRLVAFQSGARNLVIGNNQWPGIFVHDSRTGVTERVSVSSSGAEASTWCFAPSISGDGRYVAFTTYSDNLVPGDTNGTGDVFVRDLKAGTTERVSVSSSGVEGNNASHLSSVSREGRYVAFQSGADNLVAGDNNGVDDIFVHDRQTGETKRVSVNSLGVEGRDGCARPSISGSGRYVTFDSRSNNLVRGDTNRQCDIFVHDRQTGLTERVSINSLGAEGNRESNGPTISADGRYVAFGSESDNLAPGDTNGVDDVFVHDRQTGVTERISVDSSGVQSNGPWCWATSISSGGRYVAFTSSASDLVPADTNGRYGLWDSFIRDRETGVTERVSVNSLGIEGKGDTKYPVISADGRYVAFESDADNLVLGDTNGREDVFVHDRWSGSGQNSIYLTGPVTAPTGAPIDFTWQTTRGNSHYWLLYSQNMNGARADGHKFDIGYPVSILARGVNSTNGLGSHTSLPVPPRAAGYTIYFEVAARDANGVAYDSNVVGVTFQ